LRAGRVAGVQLIFNNWFLALIVLFAFAGLAGKALTVFAAVLWHEAAHAAAATALGYRVREIELLPFGGVARIERADTAGAASEIIMAAAGPLASLVLAAAVYLARDAFPAHALWFDFYCQANLMLAFFNLLPALPLDGGRILRALLALRWDWGEATTAVAGLGKLLAVILVVVVGVGLWRSATVNLTFLAAAVWLFFAARAETAAAGFRAMRILARKKAELTARGVMPTVHLTALASVRVSEVVRLFGPEHYHVVLVVDGDCRLRGALTETEVWEGWPGRGFSSRIGDFL
jgi:stage IV sporulation protein FB